jgi:hypothetical protein
VTLQVFFALPADPVRDRKRQLRDDLFVDAFAQPLGEVAGVDGGGLLYLRELGLGLGLTHLHVPIRVKRSGSVKGVKDGQERQALLT